MLVLHNTIFTLHDLTMHVRLLIIDEYNSMRRRNQDMLNVEFYFIYVSAHADLELFNLMVSHML